MRELIERGLSRTNDGAWRRVMAYRILIIDGNWLAFVKFQKEQDLTPGFLWKLLDLRDEYNPSLIYVVWDDPRGSGRRRKISPGYKSGRPPKDPKFVEQVDDLRRVLSWMGIAQMDSPYGEGDDCAATITRRYPGPQLLYAADKDWLQLIKPGVDMLKAGCGGKPDLLATAGDCKEATGFSPAEWTDYLTLCGDSVDSISGVPGVGKTWAKRLVEAMPSFVDILLIGHRDGYLRELAAAADVAKLGKYVELCIQNREAVALTRKLIDLYTVDLEVQAPDLEPELIEIWAKANDLEHVWRRM